MKKTIKEVLTKNIILWISQPVYMLAYAIKWSKFEKR